MSNANEAVQDFLPMLSISIGNVNGNGVAVKLLPAVRMGVDRFQRFRIPGCQLECASAQFCNLSLARSSF